MKKIALLAGLLIVVILAFSHEYILLAYKFKVSKGDTLEMHLFVADGFNLDMERPMQPQATSRFELLNENGVINLLSATAGGALPIVYRQVDFEGLGLLYMERKYAYLNQPTANFLAYLREDHIDNIKIKNDPLQPLQRERYTRYIKSLVQSGQPRKDTLFKTNTGQQFEIILLQNPYLLKIGASLQVQLLFKGRPLTGKVVTARNRTGALPAIAITASTNQQGICSFPLPRQGEWFIHVTHMIPCMDKSIADWESFWASYSFGISK